MNSFKEWIIKTIALYIMLCLYFIMKVFLYLDGGESLYRFGFWLCKKTNNQKVM